MWFFPSLTLNTRVRDLEAGGEWLLPLSRLTNAHCRILTARSEHSLCWFGGLTPEGTDDLPPGDNSGSSELEIETEQAERGSSTLVHEGSCLWGEIVVGQGRLGLEPRDSCVPLRTSKCHSES